MKIYFIMYRDISNEKADAPDKVVCASQYQYVVDHDLALYTEEACEYDIYYVLDAWVD